MQNGHERHKPGAAKPSKGYKALRTPAHESFAFSRQVCEACVLLPFRNCR